MNDCIFCKIANHEIPSKIIYEDDVCLAFLDLSQTTQGHTLVIPKKHFDHYLDVDQDTLAYLIQTSQNVAKTLENKLQAQGFNIITNMNEVAGQTVKHFHIHIIPRYQTNDDFHIQYTDHSNDVNLDEIYNCIMNS